MGNYTEKTSRGTPEGHVERPGKRHCKDPEQLVTGTVRQLVQGSENDPEVMKLRDDPKAVKLAVQQQGTSLKYASERLRDDAVVVKLAVQRDGHSLEYASERLRNDPEVVKLAVQTRFSGTSLEYASERLRDDAEVVKLAVQNNGISLQYASERLRDDPEVVKLAVQNNGTSLKYASERLRDDPEVVRLAVQSDVFSLQYASKLVRNDPSIVNAADPGLQHLACSAGFKALEIAPEQLRDDPDFVRTAVLQSPHALQFASQRLRNDPRIVKAAVQRDGDALQFASELLRDDLELVITAVRNSGSALRYASKALQGDAETVQSAALAKRNYCSVLPYASCQLQQDMGPMLVALADIRMAQEAHNHKGALAVLSKLQPPLNQHPLLLRAAGLLNAELPGINDTKKEHGQIILSVKFDLHADGSHVASSVYDAMCRNSALDKFKIYLPNTFGKGFCRDMKTATVEQGHCFGACERKCCKATCDGNNGSEIQFGRRILCRDFPGKITTHSCWAWSFRWHLRCAAQGSSGLMVQVEESGGLGAGQRIETRMAAEEGLKVVRVEVPEHGWADDAVRRLGEEITRWRARGCDKQLQVIKRGDY